jgi:paraquat-inducible protein B
MDLQPERVVGVNGPELKDTVPEDVVRQMVAQGVRAELDTASFVTGQKIVSLDKVPGAGRARVTVEGDALVMPSVNGGLDATIANLADITAKIDKMPLTQIGENVNRLLVTTNHTVASTNVKQTLQALTTTLDTANQTLGTVNQDYGTDSDFERSLAQLLAEARDTLRSVKQLTDYLDRNPQSLLLGRGP